MFTMGTASQSVENTEEISPMTHTFTKCRQNWKIYIFPKARRRKKAIGRGILCIWNRKKFNQSPTLRLFDIGSKITRTMSKLPMEIHDLPEEMFEERAPQGDASRAGPSSLDERRQEDSQTDAGIDLFSLPEPRLFRPISIESFQLEISPDEDSAQRTNNATTSRPPNQIGEANWMDFSEPSQSLNLTTNLNNFDSSSRLNWVSGQSAFHPFLGHASGSGQTQAPQLSLPISQAGIPSLPLENHLLGNNRNKRPREENIHLPGQFEAGESSRPAKRLKVTWWDNNYFPQTSYLPRNNTRNTYPNPRPLPIRNTVYDPLYGRAGLPVDPHLRLFQARREGNGDGL